MRPLFLGAFRDNKLTNRFPGQRLAPERPKKADIDENEKRDEEERGTKGWENTRQEERERKNK